MIDPSTGKFPVDSENRIKFNLHANFCGLSDCVHFNSCGQALRDIDKHKLIDKGYVPQVDKTKGSKRCYSDLPVEESEGKLITSNDPDWPAK